MNDEPGSIPPHYPRPQGVRVVRANGEVIPIELSLRGVENGSAVWEIDTEVDLRNGDKIECDVMPAHTAIGWPEKK